MDWILRTLFAAITLVLISSGVARADPALNAVPISQVTIDDSFWSPERDVWRKVTIADCFDKFEKDGALGNFDNIRDGRITGEHAGPPWYDGLVYEMITGAADFLLERPDPQLRRRIDRYVERIAAAAAKDPDGYLNTYTQLKEPTHRWGANGGNDVQQHDLYNAGCLVEAGVHYYRATGTTDLLRVAVRLSNHMCDVMGPSPRQNIVPGHALGEAALLELYQIFREQPELKKRLALPVDEARYLELARFWIDTRGNHAGRRSFGAYDQDDRPVLQQQTIEGHAVRATLLATGLTSLASATDRDEYRKAATRLWENMTARRMYVTGGVGALAGDEKFAADYVLPNNGYLETCAAVGAAFFHHRMNLDSADARYADELERVLYNGALCGVSIDGNRYFYDNPLEAGKGRLRWAWHACPCCPPMFLKLMGAVPGYVYATAPDKLFVNLYIGSTLRTRLGANEVVLRQTTRYPWDGAVRFSVENDAAAEFEVNLRVPAWCQADSGREELYTPAGRPASGALVIKVNGQPQPLSVAGGYARLRRRWQRGDVIGLDMQMPPRRIAADPRVAATAGKVALSRGPLVYCLESIDNDGRVRNLSLPQDARVRTEYKPDLLGGVTVLRASGLANALGQPAPQPCELTAIPYYANANRGPVSMCVWIACAPADALPDESAAAIRVNARDPGRPTSRYLSGACIEDVNHEIYGGIYSQMIFGESFQEPPRTAPVKGFTSPDGEWRVQDGEVHGSAGPGPKLVSSTDPFLTGEIGVDVFLPGESTGNAGLVLRVNRATAGADNFDGYEISVDAARKRLVLGRHQHDFRLLKEAPVDVAPDRWIPLAVKLGERSIDISVDGKPVLQFEDNRPLKAGTLGLRQWQRTARYRNLWVKTGEKRQDLSFEPTAATAVAVSGVWRPITRGNATLEASIDRDRPFVGAQSQRLAFASGAGEAGIDNQGLNGWGMSFVAAKPCEGYIWLRADKPTDVYVALENRDGARAYAETRLVANDGDWHRYDFTLTPDAADEHGQFAIKLKSPGSVTVGHAFLQPGDWGRFKGLPLRRDVVEGLIDQRITVLRYGGSMANAAGYRWKKMIGPRDRRPPYPGTWYPYSTNGWAIPDFLDLCDAAGFLAIPDFNIDETPQDMADFMEYANGPADSDWGRRRAAAGHPRPYGLKYLELGNEERVDDRYYEKFAAIAKAVWAKDPDIVLVVGDFAYNRPIADPMRFNGADSRITSLAAHEKILRLARENNREVWFDVHVWTDGPAPSSSLTSLPTFIDALDKIAAGAKHRVVVFELNANNPAQGRALANAWAVGVIQRDGRVPIVCSANCLQPDAQNDNGWDQGLLFLNPSKTWLQPPGYVLQMISHTMQDRQIPTGVSGAEGKLDVTATRSDDGKTIVLRIVNLDAQPRQAQIRLDGFTPTKPSAAVEELTAPLDARNTAAEPRRIKPTQRDWRHDMSDGIAAYTFPPHSFTIIRFE
jgi:DUF1680 family protein